MSYNDAIRALDGFFLRAAMQTDPCLEGMEDEGLLVGMERMMESQPEEFREQLDLFGADEAPATPKTKQKRQSVRAVEKPADRPPVQEQELGLKRLSYQECLDIFCGNHAAAKYWYNKQN